MGLQGSRNVDFGQFSQLQLCEPIFASDKVVLACRPLGLTMLSHAGGPSGWFQPIWVHNGPPGVHKWWFWPVCPIPALCAHFWLRQNGFSIKTTGADYVESCWGQSRWFQPIWVHNGPPGIQKWWFWPVCPFPTLCAHFWLRQSDSIIKTTWADYVESCLGSIRVIPANMSAQWASRGPETMILASLPR